MTRVGQWLISRSNAVVVTIAAIITVTATITAITLGARQAQQNEALLHLAVAQNNKQQHLLTRGLNVLCQSSFNTLVIDKALRNLGQQAGLNVSGIPNRLPPETEALCADLSLQP